MCLDASRKTCQDEFLTRRADAAHPTPLLIGLESERKKAPETFGKQEIEASYQEQSQPRQVSTPPVLQTLHRCLSILWWGQDFVTGTHAGGVRRHGNPLDSRRLVVIPMAGKRKLDKARAPEQVPGISLGEESLDHLLLGPG